MQYYVIRPSLNKKILGHYPQVKDVKYNCHVWDEPKFVEHLYFKKANFEPITANAILYASSKVTDLIDVGAMGFAKKLLVSGKLKEIINKHRSSGLQFFRSGVYKKNDFIEDFWILNVFEINMEMIDFKNSQIFKTKNVFNKISQININNISEYNNIKKNIDKEGYPYGLLIEKLKISFDQYLDFFALIHVEGGAKYIVSEKLKKEIENQECTGIEFMPVEMRLTEWLGEKREKVYGKS